MSRVPAFALSMLSVAFAFFAVVYLLAFLGDPEPYRLVLGLLSLVVAWAIPRVPYWLTGR